MPPRRSTVTIVACVVLAACAAHPPSPPLTIVLPPAAPDPSDVYREPKAAAATPVSRDAPDRRALLDPSLASVSAPYQYRARFTTTQGDFVVDVHRDWAPNGADRFFNLVRIGFYDGTRFFRAIDGFMVQWGISGDPAVSTAWHEARAKDDPRAHSNVRGTISFAKTGAPDSATTQVFVNYGDNGRLDAIRFTPFGEVTEGMGALDALYKGYGEGGSMGKGPDQHRIEREGDAYLEGFPNLDRVLRARIEGD
jgi:peptidyl-prolyl cis-trans isomerase A (cyclophilin A)